MFLIFLWGGSLLPTFGTSQPVTAGMTLCVLFIGSRQQISGATPSIANGCEATTVGWHRPPYRILQFVRRQ